MTYNTGETDESLRQEYNPEGSMMRELQYRMLDMLLYLDDVCKKLNIQYYLDGGTCLGAVRHGGFIPWDDDMDVVIDVKDYKRLCDYLLEHPHPQYILHNRQTDDNYYVGWAKLRDLQSESTYHGDNVIRGNQERIFKYSGVIVGFFAAKACETAKNTLELLLICSRILIMCCHGYISLYIGFKIILIGNILLGSIRCLQI